MSRADIDVIKALMKAYKGNQLRLPLHVAVMISPLYLLVPIQLYSVKWERRAMFLVRRIFSLVAFSDDFQTSKAMGNSKPPLLVEVENQLLALLFRIACSEKDLRTEIQHFSSWLEGKQSELINEAPDTRAWFKCDPSHTQNETSSTSMNVLAPKFPVFTLSLQWHSVGNVAIGGGNQQVGDGHMDSPEANVSDEDEDKSDEDKIDDDSLDEDRIDDNNPDMDRIDKDKAENDGLDTDKMDIDRNWEHERAGHRNGDSGAAEENASVGGLAGEGNDEDNDDMDNNGMEDIIDTDTGRRASVAGENVGGDSGAEDGMKRRKSSSEEDVEEKNGDKEDDTDALSSIAEEDDDEGRCGKAEKGKKPQKEGKLLIKIPSRIRSKGWNLGKAGLRKETAIDVDAFFVSNLSYGFLMGLFNSAFLVCRRNFLGTPKKSQGSG